MDVFDHAKKTGIYFYFTTIELLSRWILSVVESISVAEEMDYDFSL